MTFFILLCSVDNMELVHGFFNKLGYEKTSFSYFCPSQWGSTWPSIQCFVWWYTNAHIVTIIIEESINGIYLSYIPNHSNMHTLSISSMVQIVLSIFPLGFGWKVVLMCNFVPNALYNALQNAGVNLGSRYDIISAGTPCCLTIWHMYIFAKIYIFYMSLMVNKWVTFVNRSTRIQIALFILILPPVSSEVVFRALCALP